MPGDAARPTVCSFGNLADGAVRTMTIEVHILPDFVGALHNDTRVSSSTLDDDLSDNLDTIVTEVSASADLSITKSDSPDPVLAGDELTYTLNVTNGGPSTAEDVSITDELPDDVTFVEGVDGNGATVCALLQPGEVVCELGDLDPGESVTVYITVVVDASVPDGTVLVNRATVTSSTPDPNPANNTDTESTNVDTAADIWLDKTATQRSGNPAPVVVYDLIVHNDAGCESDAQSTPTPNCGTGGPSDAKDIVVTDILPLTNKKMTVQFVSPQCVYTKATHTVGCTAATLPAGATVRFVIEAQVQGSVGTILNQASVTSTTPDPDLEQRQYRVPRHEGRDRQGQALTSALAWARFGGPGRLLLRHQSEGAPLREKGAPSACPPVDVRGARRRWSADPGRHRRPARPPRRSAGVRAHRFVVAAATNQGRT